jgi:hypothetical protein
MKKIYILNVEGKNRDRLLDAAKHDIRKYVKRERSRPLPAGVDFLDFDCKLGSTQEAATAVHFAALSGAIDTLTKDGAVQFYAEVVARNSQRTFKPQEMRRDQENTNDSDQHAD